MGFAVPLAQWFRGPLREPVRDAVLGLAPGGDRLVRRELPAPAGRITIRAARDHSTPLWTLLMFESFLRNVVPDSSGVESARTAA